MWGFRVRNFKIFKEICYYGLYLVEIIDSRIKFVENS